MKVLSLFSGAGGLDLGLIQAGHEIVWANDSDRDAVATYMANIGQEIVHDDIANVETTTLPSADVVVGGFPCQGFSQANLRRSGSDARNLLFWQFVRVLRERQPRYFLAENVRGILSLDGGAALQRIVSEFSASGYYVDFRLLDAADFGVPQHRRRVIFAGTRLDLKESHTLTFPSATHASPASADRMGLHPWVSVGDALSEIPDIGDVHDLPNHVCSQYKVEFRNFTGHRRTDPAKPCPTILARGNGKGGVCAIPHPYRPRRMSVRESATVQTFPKAFAFVGSLNSMYRQVGNAVPVLLGRRLGEALARAEAGA